MGSGGKFAYKIVPLIYKVPDSEQKRVLLLCFSTGEGKFGRGGPYQMKRFKCACRWNDADRCEPVLVLFLELGRGDSLHLFEGGAEVAWIAESHFLRNLLDGKMRV